MRRTYALALLASAGFAAVLAVGSVECSSTPDSAANDAGEGGDAGKKDGTTPPLESGPSCTIDPYSIDDTSYWLTSGWEPLGGVMACCPVASATDPPTQLPPLTWIPCQNGAPDCVEVQHSWKAAFDFGYVFVSRDSSGVPKLLKFSRQQVGSLPHQGYYEDDVYDFSTQNPVAGWRQTYNPPCPFLVSVGGTSIGLWALGRDPTADYVAAGQPPLAQPVFLPFSGKLEALMTGDVYVGSNTSRMSSTSLAFDLVMGWNGLVRMPVGNPSGYVMSKPPYPDIGLEMVEGDDVYGVSYATQTGWQAEYVMAADGTMNLYRAKDQTHIFSMRSDGTTMFWVETYGLPAPNYPLPFVPQPNMDVWAAPYTNDPTQLAVTAKKIASIPNPWGANAAVAFGGIYAVSSAAKTISVVRLADGAVQQVSAGPDRAFHEIAFVSSSEVWVTLDAWDDDAGTDGRTVALARYTLHDW